jgi:ribosomal protein L7/L12
VLDAPGRRHVETVTEIRRLTGLSFPDALDLIGRVPVPVLRVPDLPMADAARSILERAGATVSITGPGAGVSQPG